MCREVERGREGGEGGGGVREEWVDVSYINLKHPQTALKNCIVVPPISINPYLDKYVLIQNFGKD